jgi:DNA-binding transcriptional LysR family regulator
MRVTQYPLALTALALGLGLTAAPAFAERDLVPTLERSFNVCPDRPTEPIWMQDIPLRQAYQRVLVQDIYRAQNLERIVETGNCDCEIRFPSWDAAEAMFRERHTSDERWEMLQVSDGYNRRANDVRLEAKVLCDAEGNW